MCEPCRKRRTAKTTKAKKKTAESDDNNTGSFFWRVFYASIPFQFLLLAAVLLAWSYQPKCCEASNGFVLMPQLRYFNGPPPI